jgi:putative membrane protein
MGEHILKPVQILFAAALATSACGLALAQPAGTQINKADADRLVAIAQANIAEVEAGNLALEKSSNADVKAFAQMMIDDHSKGLEETRKVAAAKNVTLPSEPDAAHKKLAAELKALSGSGFDTAYVTKAGVADHTKVHAALRKDISAAQDPDVKELAAKLEPTVAHHLAMAKKLGATPK